MEAEIGSAMWDYLLSMNSAIFFVTTEGRPDLFWSGLPIQRPSSSRRSDAYSMSCSHDVFFRKFPHDLRRRLALLLSRISTQTARHTFRVQEDNTRNVAWSKSTISHYINTHSHMYMYVTQVRAMYTVITFERHCTWEIVQQECTSR